MCKVAVAILGVSALVLGGLAAPALGKPKPPAKPMYYVQVMDALADKGVPESIKPAAKSQLEEALRARPEVVLAGTAVSAQDEATLVADLKKRKLKGLALSVRVLELSEEIKPPPEGKKSRVLQISARVSIFGSTIPAAGLAIGGDGQSRVGFEVGKNILPGDRAEATRSALSQSLTQAVDQAITKLSTPAVVPKPEKRRKKP